VGTPFENFLNLEIPQRAVMLTGDNTEGYVGDPNYSLLNKINYSPKGTWFIDEATGTLWQKLVQSDPLSWTNRSVGGGSSVDPNLTNANCLASDIVGDLVYVTGNIVGGRIQVTEIDNTDSAKMPVFGMIETKASSTVCTVRTGGTSAGIYSGLVPQRRLFAGDNGRLVQTVPARPSSGKKLVQPMGIATSSSVIFLRIGETIGIVP
jgi:hypothetical protein